MALNIVSEIDRCVSVRHVLMSVSDKTGLDTFVPALIAACPEVKIFSTGEICRRSEDAHRRAIGKAPRLCLHHV